MTTRIACYTLFDITATGVPNRNIPPVDVNVQEWIHKRNTQCNYDTVLQIVSLRSQPENLQLPQKLPITKDTARYFGSDYRLGKNTHYWMFEFSVQHISAFNNGIDEIGSLFSDSNGVPMILVGNEVKGLDSTLNTTPQLKNIHYIIVAHEND